MDHNLRHLPHCPKHHRSCCSGPPFLRNYTGRLCSLYGNRYILATVDSAPSLVPLASQTEKEKVLDLALGGLVWKEGRLLPADDFLDGVEVKFDAVLKSAGQGAYQIVFVWIGPKPEQVQVPAEGTCLLMKYYTNVEIDCSLAGSLFVKVNLGRNVYQLETPKAVVVHGNHTDISDVEMNQLEKMKACISVVLSKTLTGFQTQYIVAALYIGDLPKNMQNPSKMKCYEEPLTGSFQVAKEIESISFDVRFYGENFKHLLHAIMKNTATNSLCRNLNHLVECVAHLLVHNRSKQVSMCFFSDLSYCYARTSDGSSEEETNCTEEELFDDGSFQDIVPGAAETPQPGSEVIQSQELDVSFGEVNIEHTHDTERLRHEMKSKNSSQTSPNGVTKPIECDAKISATNRKKKSEKPRTRRRKVRNQNKRDHPELAVSVNKPPSPQPTDQTRWLIDQPLEAESPSNDAIHLETSQCRPPSWDYPTVLPGSHRAGYYKKILLLSKEHLVKFTALMQQGSPVLKTLRERQGVAHVELLTSVPNHLHYLLHSMRVCQVRRWEQGASPETVLKLVDLLSGKEHWLLFKVLKETVLLPLSNVMCMKESLSQSLMMLTVPLETLVFLGGHSINRLAIAAYEEEPPVYLTKNILEDWIMTGKLITQSKLDSLIGRNPAGLNTTFAIGIRVVGYLMGCQRAAEEEAHYFVLKCFPANDHEHFYATVDLRLKYNVVNGGLLHLEDFSSLALDTLHLCLACVRPDDRPSPMFPGYVATDVILGSDDDLRTLARTWKKRCSSHLTEWRK